MTLNQIKEALQKATEVNFKLHTGNYVPSHFHITEIGLITKHFIDCGGTIRSEKNVSFQLWNANDTDHRLKPQKLLDIINLSQQKLGIENHEVEVEYQTETIGKYNVFYDGKDFLLTPKHTACLAEDSCGIKPEHLNITKKNIETCCTPGSGCC